MNASVLASDSRLFDIRPTTQFIPNESSWFKGGRDFLGANPAFGAYINYYLKAAAKEDLKITITDVAGKVVRELAGPKEAGLHRVLWDLRTTPAGPPTIGFYFQTDITNLGAFVLPGEYRIKLSGAGADQTKPVRIDGDPLVQMTDADRKSLYDTLVNLTAMQSTVQSAATAITKIDQSITQMTDTLKSYPNAPTSLKTAVETAAQQLRDLRTKAIGGGGGGGGGEGGGGNQPLRGRITNLKSEVVYSQSVPTAVQSRQVGEIAAELNGVVNQVNTWINTTLPNLYKQLADNNVHPSAGAPIKPIGQ
jgi:hypothetical protein